MAAGWSFGSWEVEPLVQEIEALRLEAAEAQARFQQLEQRVQEAESQRELWQNTALDREYALNRSRAHFREQELLLQAEIRATRQALHSQVSR